MNAVASRSIVHDEPHRDPLIQKHKLGVESHTISSDHPHHLKNGSNDLHLRHAGAHVLPVQCAHYRQGGPHGAQRCRSQRACTALPETHRAASSLLRPFPTYHLRIPFMMDFLSVLVFRSPLFCLTSQALELLIVFHIFRVVKRLARLLASLFLISLMF